MKKYFVSMMMLLTAALSWAQSRQTGIGAGQAALVDSLEQAIGNSWVRENPAFIQTLPSYFYKGNEDKFKVAMLHINALGVPFVFDSGAAQLDYLLYADSNVTLSYGTDASKSMQGVKASWKRNLYGIAWINGKTYKTGIANWHLAANSECSGKTIFPVLWFKNIEGISKASSSVTDAISILPYKEELLKIWRTNLVLKTNTGQSIKGLAYDLNDDGKPDLFSYDEKIGDATYTRIYMNVEGHWRCKWAHLEEACP